ncbi:MAG: dTDP-4-dehydrorhamnose 3,5-epimerase [Spirochaetaceae bacterium]|nr:dTDP-4-dehydrorhamnose 3,5-epimerase [Spirochaetaceae bacterium]
MAFIFTPCPIKGLFEIQPKIFGDNRGYFAETYNEIDFFNAGITEKFVQDNQSSSVKGVLRGLHFQKQHPQGKLVRCLQGKVFDVAVDLRNDSVTFGKWHGVILSEEKQNQFYIPQGFAHGFLVLSDSAIFAYKCTDFYHPEYESGIIYNDATLNINWNNIDGSINPILSEKDKNHPIFDPKEKYYDINGNWIG